MSIDISGIDLAEEKEGAEHFYKLALRPFPEFQNLTSSEVIQTKQKDERYNKYTEDKHMENQVRPALPKKSEEDKQRARRAIQDGYENVFGKEQKEG